MRTLTKAVSLTVAALTVAAVGYGVADAASSGHGNEPAAVVSPNHGLPATPETSFVAITPCRIVDTRVSGGSFADGAARAYHVRGSAGIAGQGGKSGGCGVPASATAVNITLTAFAATGSGRFVAYPSGTSAPDASTARYSKGLQSSGSTAALLGVGSPYDLRIKNDYATASLLIDVTGYYAPPLNADIADNGTLRGGSGRALSSSHATTGNYTVTFDRDVSNCSYAATPYNFNYVVAVGPEPGLANTVHMYIHDEGGSTTAHDTSFYLLVTC